VAGRAGGPALAPEFMIAAGLKAPLAVGAGPYDERSAWVQRSLFVAEGRLVPGGVEYDVARVL
jgi:hypothetical protein